MITRRKNRTPNSPIPFFTKTVFLQKLEYRTDFTKNVFYKENEKK